MKKRKGMIVMSIGPHDSHSGLTLAEAINRLGDIPYSEMRRRRSVFGREMRLACKHGEGLKS